MIFFFFNDTATTEIYTLSLHDALPISCAHHKHAHKIPLISHALQKLIKKELKHLHPSRSEEHTSELQSQSNLVCRLLLEKKKKKKKEHKKNTNKKFLIQLNNHNLEEHI